MKLSPSIVVLLDRGGGSWDRKISASRVWTLTYFAEGPPPVALSLLRGKKGKGFYEELVKLVDVKKVWDARAVLVVAPESVDADRLQLATNFGVYLVHNGDLKGMESALEGNDVADVNAGTLSILLSKKSRSAASECRLQVLETLEKKWMTLRELEDQLKWRHAVGTVRSQIRALQREGSVYVGGRIKSGEGLLGLKQRSYGLRPDLSMQTMNRVLSEEILRIIGGAEKPVNYRELYERLGVKRHVATAALRKLAKGGKVAKEGEGWVIVHKAPQG